MRPIAFLALLLVAAPATRADDETWVSLFNGKDLKNWVNVNGAPETWTVDDGVIKCTGKPTGALRTPRMYENFVLELEWRHMRPGGNAGVFIWGSAIAAPGVPFLRAIEVQVLDNAFSVAGKNEWYTTHGDVFPIHGATMKPIHRGHGMRCFPMENRSKSSPEWNQYRIVGQDGKLRLSVNGKEVSGGDDCVWRKGYLGLESEGAPTEWRNIRIQELPSGGAPLEQTAPEEQGWQTLYNGVDLRGWQAAEERSKKWSPHDWRLKCAAGADPLVTDARFADFELIVDVQTIRGTKAQEGMTGVILTNGGDPVRVPLYTRQGSWVRNHLSVHGTEVVVRSKTNQTLERQAKGPSGPASIGLAGEPKTEVEFANIYVRESK